MLSALDWFRAIMEGWDCGSDKSRAPNGFTFEFFLIWPLVGEDVSTVVNEFFSSSIFPNCCNPLFIALVPKVKEKTLLFKVDFQKAFDSVRWDHLDDILRKFGFDGKRRGWIRGCLHSLKASVLVNCSPIDELLFRKGLRQRDSLPPFLFILVMEGLHVAFQRVIDRGTKMNERKMTWVCWRKVMTHKQYGGLGDASVAQKFQNSDFVVSFRRRPKGGIEESQLQKLYFLLSLVVLSSSNDRWSWTLNDYDDFLVKSAKKEINKHLLVTSSSSTRQINGTDVVTVDKGCSAQRIIQLTKKIIVTPRRKHGNVTK
nr:RNA-directed DNA polymerase, eukaryota, reverse transcriptase zinc-binding domain protein [Tanacetum cinerariifolium]